MNALKIIFTDLDGTLYHQEKGFNPKDIESLKYLKTKGVVRVLATGRNLLSVDSVIDSDFPIDYLIFSTGAGIMEWKRRELLISFTMPNSDVRRIATLLINQKVTFMIHKPVPDNHQFVFNKTRSISRDFYKRLQTYRNHHQKLKKEDIETMEASQFLCMLPNDNDEFNRLAELISGVKIIKTSSPIGKGTLWLEIFPESVSKGHAAAWLCQFLNVNPEESMGVGNDFNDLDMLEYVKYAYVVSNAPEEMKTIFKTVDLQKNAGFSEAINKFFTV